MRFFRKTLLLVALALVMLAAISWAAFDARAVESANAARAEVDTAFKGLVRQAQSDAEPRLLKDLRAVMESVIGQKGGMKRPEFLVAKSVKIHCRDTALAAAALLPVLSVLEGDAERAKHDVADYRQMLVRHGMKHGPEGVAPLIDSLSAELEKIERDPEQKTRAMENLRRQIAAAK